MLENVHSKMGRLNEEGVRNARKEMSKSNIAFASLSFGIPSIFLWRRCTERDEELGKEMGR